MDRHVPASRLRCLALLVALLCVASACAASNAASPPPSSSTAAGGSTSTPRGPAYVALGDSYTSAPLVPVTDVAGGCFRSSANYPALVAKKLHAQLKDVSCGGAKIAHLTTGQHPGVAPQLDELTPNTTLVTIGLGGNDQDVFGQLTGRCPALRSTDPRGAPCRDAMTSGGHDVLLAELQRTSRTLAAALRQVHRLAPRAKVLVVGYPQIVSADHVCGRLPLARGDFAYAAKIGAALDDAVRRAAQASSSTYVDVFTASKGHDICSGDPWINGSVNDQKRAAAYHPFAVEQQAVAGLVVQALHG